MSTKKKPKMLPEEAAMAVEDGTPRRPTAHQLPCAQVRGNVHEVVCAGIIYFSPHKHSIQILYHQLLIFNFVGFMAFMLSKNIEALCFGAINVD